MMGPMAAGFGGEVCNRHRCGNAVLGGARRRRDIVDLERIGFIMCCLMSLGMSWSLRKFLVMRFNDW